MTRKRKQKTVREQAEAMIKRYGRSAARYAHWRADDARRESTAMYWEDVERMIDKLVRGW